MVAFGQSGCIQQKLFSWGKVAVFGKNWLCSGKSSYVPAKVVVFGQSGCIPAKVFVFL